MFGATSDRSVNQAVCCEAQQLGLLVNVVDDPSLCTFIVPSKLARGPVQIAISTQGASPALARELRRRLEEAVPPEYGLFASLLGRLRPEVMAAHASSRDREARWRQVLHSEVLALLRERKHDQAEETARGLLGLAGPTRGRMSCQGADVAIATRGSALALAQSRLVAERLRSLGSTVDIHVVHTTGDVLRGPLPSEGTGVFVKEIEHALLSGEANVAVHSMKDLPTGRREGLVIAAVPVRDDPHDALVTRSGLHLDQLPAGSRIATSSPRRKAQLRAYRPDLEFVPVRGNVDTRLRKLSRGDFDALVVAQAGLARLGLADSATELIPLGICLPAPGQGALAIQVRESDHRLRDLLAPLDHLPSRLAVEAERAFLSRLGAGCSLPAAALGAMDGDRLVLEATVADPEGKGVFRECIEGSAAEAEALGHQLAETLLAAGAAGLLVGKQW